MNNMYFFIFDNIFSQTTLTNLGEQPQQKAKGKKMYFVG